MLILSLHSGPHDSAAALFDDYRILAAVAEERLNRKKGAGGFPAQAIAEVLRIAGVDRRQVDVAVCTRSYYPRHYFTHWRPHERLREELRRLAGHSKTIEVGKVLYTARRRDPNHTPDQFFNRRAFLGDLGLRPDASLFFSNHHFSHGLPSLFFTDWEEALLYTADGNGDHVFYSHYLFKDGQLTNLYGDDRWLGRAHPSGSLALAYGNVTDALGFRSNRHEGKLTGLAAYGQPTLLPEMQRHFTVSEDGRIEMDFADIFAMREHFVDSRRARPAKTPPPRCRRCSNGASPNRCGGYWRVTRCAGSASPAAPSPMSGSIGSWPKPCRSTRSSSSPRWAMRGW